VIAMVVDGRTELASPDIELARLLIRSGKPVLLAVNKIDSPKIEAIVEDFRRLGIKDVFPVSAEHGNGLGELLDAVLQKLPNEPREAAVVNKQTDEVAAEPRPPLETKIAIIGRPNVGKSTLLNQLTGSSRAIVSPIAGTTRDAVDALVERQGERYRFIDYAAAKEAMVRGEKEWGHVGAYDVDPAYRGRGLQLEFKVDDPAVFTMPWTATVTYLRSIHTEWEERVCAENVEHYYTLTRYYSDRSAHIPTAPKPDF